MPPRIAHWSAVHLMIACWCLALVIAGALQGTDPTPPSRTGSSVPAFGPSTTTPVIPLRTAAQTIAPTIPPTRPTPPATLPGGRSTVFGGHFLVAYYGTAGSGSLGVLGDAPPDQIWPRLVRAGRPFATPGHAIQPVFELIVSVASRWPGPDGDYSNDIPAAAVREYIRAAHRHGALVILDLQTGRSPFLRIARRWAWALRDPWVGLAIDPEWRMGPHDVPGQRIGSVDASEINQVSGWLNELTARDDLPQKIFMVHQFRTDMVRNIGRVVDRPHLAMIQHVDGFGTRGEKLSTYHSVVQPGLFHEGFKLFYHQDIDRMSAQRVLRIRPRVQFVSFQ